MPRVTKKTERPPKEQRLFDNLFKITQQFMMGKGYVPLTEAELMERLSLPPQHEEIFRDILKTLVKQNQVEVSRERYTWHQNKSDVITGLLRLHPRGFGFVQVTAPSPFEEDVFIPKHLTKNAVDGDQVEIVVSPAPFSEKGPEGKVVAILSRGRTHLAGIVLAAPKGKDILAHVPLLGSSQRVIIEADPKRPLVVGDRVIMEVVEWGDKDSETYCRFSEHIGHISDPSCDIPAAIAEFGLRSDFTPRVVKEAIKFGKSVSQKDIKTREDLREWETFTIDPDTAKDFDDALSLSKDKKGNYHLGVHIADVSHYVTPGSELDTEAALRCNSTYFPRTCIPMLPSVLSDNLCSLKANVNRLTVSVLMDFDPDGNLTTYRITRSVIRSAKRFSYREAKAVLDGKKKSIHEPTLQLMVEMCKVLKKKRYERGSIEFAIPDLVIVVDETGVPTGTDFVEYDITHQLVEEFMLKANEMVATHIANEGRLLAYRIHDQPADENMKEFAMLSRAFGYDLPDKPSQAQLQEMFDKALSTPFGQHLASSFIRRMRLAVYSPENIGHYGLALTHYCHFTSPIRRYVDLVAHRILFGDDPDLIVLDNVAKLCSEQERISAKAENSVVTLKKLRLLKSQQDEDASRQYDAIVTKVKPHGITFEVIDLMIEGFMHVSELENDYYIFEERQMLLRGRHSGQTYCSGDKLTVMLSQTDLITLETRWHLVESERRKAEGERKGERRTTKAKGERQKDKRGQQRRKAPPGKRKKRQ